MSALPAERQPLATAYRLALHDVQCERHGACPAREGCSWWWTAHQSPAAWLAAVVHLEAHPRDAQGARLVLHDAACSQGAECPSREHHARTQAVPVRVLRKVLAGRPLVLVADSDAQGVDTPPSVP